MANEKTKNPLQTLEDIEKALNRGTSPKELKDMLIQLKEHLDRPGYLEKAEEIEVELIRQKLANLKIKKTKETRVSIKLIKEIQSTLPEEIIEVNEEDFEIEEDFDETLFKEFENQFNKNNEAQLILEVITGNTKLLKKRGYQINHEQLSRLAKEIICTEKGKFESFTKNKREAIVLLMEFEFNPREMDKGGVTLEALKEQLEIYKEDKTKEIKTEEKGEKIDLFVEMITDKLLSAIFIEAQNEKELIEILEKENFSVKSVNQLKKIVQEVIKEVFQETIELEKVFDRETVERAIKTEEGLKKFKSALLQALPKKAITSANPSKPTKKETSISRPEPKTIEKKPAQEEPRRNIEITQEQMDKNLEEKAFQIAPDAYRKWKDLFQLLHFGRLSNNEAQRKRQLEARKKVIGIETEEMFEMIRSHLRGFEKWRKFIDAKTDIQAIRESFDRDEINNDNLGEKLKQKIEEILETVRVELKKTVKAKEPIAPTKTAVSKPLPQKPETLAKPVIAGPEAPQIPTVPLMVPTALPIAPKKTPKEKVSEKLANYVKENPEHENLLKITTEFLKIDTKGSKIIEGIKKKIQNLFETLETMTAGGTDIPAPFIKNFFENGLKPNQKIVERTMRNLKETGNLNEDEKRNFYRLLGLGKLKPKFDQLITILDINPTTIKDEEKRRYVKDIQEEILETLDEIYQDYPIFELKTLRLKHQVEKTNEILKKLEDLNEFIDYFENEIEISDQNQVVSNALVNNPATKTDTTTKNTPTENTNTTEEKNKPNNNALVIAQKKEIQKGKEQAKTNNSVSKFLESLSIKKELIRNDDPIVMAMNELLMERNDLEAIKAFLKNPDNLKRQVNEESLTAIKEEMKNKGVDDYDKLTQKLNSELKEIKEFFSLLNNRSLPAEEKNKASEKTKRKLEIEALLESTALLRRLEKGTLDYESPREVLTLVMLYLSQSDKNASMKGLTLEIEQLIDKQKDKLHKGFWSKLQAFGFFLKPTLKSTLKAIAKDAEFKKLGDNPEEKLVELNRLFGTDQTKVKEWIDSLPGGIEKNAHTTIPRLIAYLEMAVRDGKASYLFKTKDALELIKHLKEVQHKQIRTEVEKEFQEYTKKNPNEEPPNKMLMYINRLNESNRYIQDVNKRILQKNLAKTAAIRTLGTGAVIAGTVFNPFAWYTAIPGMAAIPTFIASFTKKVPKDKKALVQRSAIRAFMGNALVLGGIASTATIGALAIPLTIAGGLAGVAAPELWKHKRKIGEKSIKGITKETSWTWKNAIKPSAPYLFKGALATAGIMSIVGIPFVTYYATKKLLNKK